MSGKTSRNKGATAERYLASELTKRLGVQFARNLEQYRTPDHCDLITDLPLYIEIKNQAKPLPMSWWVAAAAKCPFGQTPILAYKVARQFQDTAWRFVVPYGGTSYTHTHTMFLDGFCAWCAERFDLSRHQPQHSDGTAPTQTSPGARLLT